MQAAAQPVAHSFCQQAAQIVVASVASHSICQQHNHPSDSSTSCT